jgi:AmiR/NasT family two-component response regulator
VERTRVIIADDESIIRMDLREMLTNLGYLVIGEVGDGRSAVNLARELRPDVVIMDIKMPDMDGIDAARVLTAERVSPVLLLTAYSQRELIERAKDAGVVGYIIKPFLMDTQGITEAEAFRKIQKMSMNTRKPMKEVAEAIILAQQASIANDQ